MGKLKILKNSIIIGILLGIGLKLRDFFKFGKFKCGLDLIDCNMMAYLKEILIWILITTVCIIVIVFGIRYLFKFITGLIKGKYRKHEKKEKAEKKQARHHAKKLHKKEKKEKEADEEEQEKENSSEESEEKEKKEESKPKKVIKI
jgi:flagellar biosynthesis component FlhA